MGHGRSGEERGRTGEEERGRERVNPKQRPPCCEIRVGRRGGNEREESVRRNSEADEEELKGDQATAR
jgi:hypothetical protein